MRLKVNSGVCWVYLFQLAGSYKALPPLIHSHILLPCGADDATEQHSSSNASLLTPFLVNRMCRYQCEQCESFNLCEGCWDVLQATREVASSSGPGLHIQMSQLAVSPSLNVQGGSGSNQLEGFQTPAHLAHEPMHTFSTHHPRTVRHNVPGQESDSNPWGVGIPGAVSARARQRLKERTGL